MSRSSFRYCNRTPDKDRPLARRIHVLAKTNPRMGYRMITKLLRREGWLVNSKRVHRLWKEAGLQVTGKQRKKPRPAQGESLKKATAAGQVWSMEFIFDTTEDGRQIKLLNIMDEYTRECLCIEVARSIKHEDVIEVLERLIGRHGTPDYLRCDNGSEFIAGKLQDHLKNANIETHYIEPGSRWQNGFIESFNSTLRNELLNRELFTTLKEAEILSEQYRRKYNDYLTPNAFIESVNQGLKPRQTLTRTRGIKSGVTPLRITFKGPKLLQ